MRRAAPFVCIFLSGAACLVDQVAWIRQATLLFGSTTLATSSIVAVFFLGLASGNALFARAALRTAHPMRTYAALEAALAALVLASPIGFAVAERLYGSFYRAEGASWAARIVLVGAVLLPPTFLMGGTLPLACRQLVRRSGRIAGTVGLVYGLNTLGAAAGCAIAGFLLLPALGLRWTLVLGAGLSLAAAAAAILCHAPQPEHADPGARRAPLAGERRWRVAALFFATGFVALGYEVLWTRFLALVVRTTVHTYTLALTAVLLGIVLGSWFASVVGDRTAHRARLFGALQVVAALWLLATLHLPPDAWRILGGEARTCIALALPPAVLSGACFPLAVRLVAQDPRFAAWAAGALAAANTVGGILGSLAVGFVALPHLGLGRSLLATTGLGLAAGCAAWLVLDPGRRRFAVVAIAASLAAHVAIPRLLPTRLPADFLAERGALVDWSEGREANLAVVRRQRALHLEADRWWQGQDRKTHQILAAHLPLLLHPDPRRVLVVGVGAGQTPARVLLYDVLQLDCVDIEPVVFDLVRRRFESAWMADPRVRLRQEDGRNYIAHTREPYDVIALEVGQIFRPGVAAFYTADFYRRARRRLAPGGLLSQFVPLAFLDPSTLRSVVASFLEAFPASTLWYNTSELLLVGANAADLELHAERLALLESNPRIHEDLSWSPWGGPAQALHRPEVFLGGFLCGPAGLARLAAGAPILRDDRPVLDHASREVDGQAANEIPLLALLRPHLEPVASICHAALPETTLAQAAAFRERNLGDIVASALLRRVEPLRAAGRYPELETLLRDALGANPENAQANRLLADLLLVRGRAAEAAPYYDRALAHVPDDPATQVGFAMLLHSQGRFTEAVGHYRRGIELDPWDPDAHYNLAAALVELGDLEGAEQGLEAALRLRPAFTAARDHLARIRDYRSHLSPR